jgi:ABC-type nitrate/sulfonate/bicarbonate transport system permease component
MSRREKVLTWLALMAGFLGAWTLASATLPLPPYYLPPPAAVLTAGSELVVKGILPLYVAESLRRILTAAVVALVVAVPTGLVLGMSRRVADVLYRC